MNFRLTRLEVLSGRMFLETLRFRKTRIGGVRKTGVNHSPRARFRISIRLLYKSR